MVIYKFTAKKTLVVLPLLLGSYSSLTFAETGESTFVKDTKTGCKIYELEEGNHSASWSGACVDGKISGNGTLTIISKKPNATCENKGEMKEGLRTGRSVTQCSDGVRIEGEYKPVAGVVNSIGTVNFPNGDKYVGEMKGMTLHGQGTYTAASGKSMTGTFSNNKLVADEKITTEMNDLMELVRKSSLLFAEKKYVEQVALIDQFLTRYSQLPKEVTQLPEFQSLISTMLSSKGTAFLLQKKYDAYFTLYDQLLNQFNQLPQSIKESPEIQHNMASAASSLGTVYLIQNLPDKAFSTWDENSKNFRASTDERVKKILAEAQVTKNSFQKIEAETQMVLNANKITSNELYLIITAKQALFLFQEKKLPDAILAFEDFLTAFNKNSSEYKSTQFAQRLHSNIMLHNARAYLKTNNTDRFFSISNDLIEKYKNSSDLEVINSVVFTFSDQSTTYFLNKNYAQAVAKSNQVINIYNKNYNRASDILAENYAVKCESLYKIDLIRSANCISIFRGKFKNNPDMILKRYVPDNIKLRSLIDNMQHRMHLNLKLDEVAPNLTEYTDPAAQAQAAIDAIETVISIHQPLSRDDKIMSLNKLWSDIPATQKSKNLEVVIKNLDDIFKQLSTSITSKDPAVQAQIASAVYNQCKLLSREPMMSGQGFACYEKAAKNFGTAPTK